MAAAIIGMTVGHCPSHTVLTSQSADVAITAVSYPPGKVCGAWPSGRGWCVYEGADDKRGGRE
jgi:hypothetical protein